MPVVLNILCLKEFTSLYEEKLGPFIEENVNRYIAGRCFEY